MKINTILFDVGDTLHSLNNYTGIARKVMIEQLIDQGVPINDVDKGQRIFERVVKRYAKPHADLYFLNADFFKKFFQEIDIKIDNTLLYFSIMTYRDTLHSLLTPSLVAITVLSTLKSMGYKLGVVTDGSKDSAYEILLRLGIINFFDAIVVSEEVGVEKPHPNIFKEALDRLNSKPSETMIVGDSLKRDIDGGKRLGMVTVLIKRYWSKKLRKTKVKPDYEIMQLDQLFELLERKELR